VVHGLRRGRARAGRSSAGRAGAVGSDVVAGLSEAPASVLRVRASVEETSTADGLVVAAASPVGLSEEERNSRRRLALGEGSVGDVVGPDFRVIRVIRVYSTMCASGERCRQMNSCCALRHVQLDTCESRGGNWHDSEHRFAECTNQCQTAVRKLPLPTVIAGKRKSTAVSEERQHESNRQCSTFRPRQCGPAVSCRRPEGQVRVVAVRKAAGSQG
jgi:hypothetical protein